MGRAARRPAAALALALAVIALAVSGRPALAAGATGPADNGVAEVRQAIASYRLGAGDKLRVTVFGEDSLTGEYFVSDSGKVSLPLVGEVTAKGLTISDFQNEVEATLRDGYLKDPKVSAEILTYRPFYILGEVNKPGTYAYSSGLTVLNAVATAEGFTYRANTKKVLIKRANESVEREYRLGPQTPVAPGDTIRIKERFF